MLGAIGALAGYGIAQIPPYHDRTTGTAKVFVLSCIDPRFANDLAWFLTHNKELLGDYDLFTLAGASLGAMQDGWKETFYKHIDLALQLHGIEELWCFDHLDCGMYKATLGLNDDNNPHIHIEKLDDLRTELQANFPSLKFRGYIFDQRGKVRLVSCSCSGCAVNN